MIGLSPDFQSVVIERTVPFQMGTETEIAGNHKKERHRKPTDSLHCNPQSPGKFAVHEDDGDASHSLHEIQGVVPPPG